MSKRGELDALHGRLVAGDPRAAHRIVELTILPLQRIVGSGSRMPDPQDVEQACLDALLDYLQTPQAYDPSKAALTTYLAAIARHKAMTIARSNVRRLARDGRYSKEAKDAEPPVRELEFDELDAAHRSELVRDDGDDLLLEVVAAGVDDPGEFARRLGLPDDEGGRLEGRRRRERMRGRLRRLKIRLEGVRT